MVETESAVLEAGVEDRGCPCCYTASVSAVTPVAAAAVAARDAAGAALALALTAALRLTACQKFQVLPCISSMCPRT